jgi:hypothetical protein
MDFGLLSYLARNLHLSQLGAGIFVLPLPFPNVGRGMVPEQPQPRNRR